MKLTPEVLDCMERSVLCWLATASQDLQPNVSPKEIFTHFDQDRIIVANIASPQSAKNIKVNPKVSVSFIDILVQKGFQAHGLAQVINASHPDYHAMEQKLTTLTQGKFPFSNLFVITVSKIKPIIAPRYLLYPSTTESEQIASAKKIYGL